MIESVTSGFICCMSLCFLHHVSEMFSMRAGSQIHFYSSTTETKDAFSGDDSALHLEIIVEEIAEQLSCHVKFIALLFP